jgi:hypothetical protein
MHGAVDLSENELLLETELPEELRGFVRIALAHDTVEGFIDATDGWPVLYRGHFGNEIEDNSFFTDYVGHARSYIDETGRIDAYAFDPRDALMFDDIRFDEMRFAYMRLDARELEETYRAALAGNRFMPDLMNRETLDVLYEILQGDTPYSDMSADPGRNDILIPLMQHYAREVKGRNVIAFVGGDFGDFGGQNEFVVGRVAELTDLRRLYGQVRAKMIEHRPSHPQFV